MASTNKEPVLVILQLTGANDYLNTIVPVSYTHLTLPTILRV